VIGQVVKDENDWLFLEAGLDELEGFCRSAISLCPGGTTWKFGDM
jgi:hypothetical protein